MTSFKRLLSEGAGPDRSSEMRRPATLSPRTEFGARRLYACLGPQVEIHEIAEFRRGVGQLDALVGDRPEPGAEGGLALQDDSQAERAQARPCACRQLPRPRRD